MNAQPAALTDSLGLLQDVAKRNRTVSVVARKLTRLKQLHPADGTCGECARPAPCPTRQIIDERPAR